MSPPAERRLHPITIGFDIAKRLGDLIVPLIVVVFLSRSATNQSRVLVPVVLGAIAAMSGVWRYFTYRYRYGENDLVIRSGVFFRNERHIPYNRIQNIDAVQNVAHRLFGVAIVQVHTGSGAEPEASMSLLPLTALEEMRSRVFAERKAVTAEAAGETDLVTALPVRLLHLPPRELLLAGLIENRGMALVFAALGVLTQIDPVQDLVGSGLSNWAPQWVRNAVTADVAGRVGSVIAIGVLAFIVVMLFVRVLSTAWAAIRLHDFTLVRVGDDLRAEYGLFTRVNVTIPIRRVQTISVHQRVLHRALGRAAIRVTTAGGAAQPGGEGVEREWLAPIIPVAAVDPLLAQLDPTLALTDPSWRRAHPGAARRLMRVSAVSVWIPAGAAVFIVGWWALGLGALLTVYAIARSRGYIRNLGYAIIGDRIVFRSGWFHHVTTVARFNRIQSASFDESPLDRRAGMARVSVDTAGTGVGGLSMPYLRREDAVALHTDLAAATVRTSFVW